MKKILCALLMLSMVFCFAACGDETPNVSSTESTKKAPGFDWPDNLLFGDVPGPADRVDLYNEKKNDRGYVYEFAVKDMGYEDYRAYILQLEEAGFEIYDPSGLGLVKTEDRLPEALSKGSYNSSWAGSRKGLYVATFWFGDEYYKEHDLADDVNFRMTFYTYNAFDAVK